MQPYVPSNANFVRSSKLAQAAVDVATGQYDQTKQRLAGRDGALVNNQNTATDTNVGLGMILARQSVTDLRRYNSMQKI